MIPSADEGSYLIITDPQFLPAVQPLAAWKEAKGLHVILVTTDETGPQNSDIKAYIAQLYATSPRPPQYVLLVGDTPDASFTGGIPGFDFAGTITDLPFGLMEGDDFLPDLYVGRLSVRSLDQAQTVVAKILRYEQNPYTEGGTEWFTRGLVVGADYASSTPVPVMRWCGKQLREIGYAQVDSVYYPPSWATGRVLIPRAVNRGVTVVAYRGWAYGTLGWEPPSFTSNEVSGLTNGWMLPVVFSFVCQNLDFRVPDCFGEVWQCAGSASQPQGAVAVIGNSEPWSHTRFNDAAAIGAFEAMGAGTRRLGEILNSFKMSWLAQFPDEIPFSGDGKESVEYYFYIYNLLGDPEMEMWMAPPRSIEVGYVNPIPLGSNALEVSVTASGEPVGGARVGVSKDGVLLGSGWTDGSGIAHLPASFAAAGEIVVTVTGKGVAPFGGTAQVVDGLPFLSYASSVIDDDSVDSSHGNGDGIPNPGEILELRVGLHNQGAAPVAGVHAALAAASGITVETGEASFPDIPAGGTAVGSTPFVVRVDPRTENGLVARLRLDATSGSDHSVSDILLEVRAADLSPDQVLIAGDGILDPGETGSFTVRLKNSGAIASGRLSAVLRTSTPDLVTPADSSAQYLSIDPDGFADPDAPFVVSVGSEVGIGRVAVFRLILTSDDGQVSETSFPVTIGKVDHSAPLGPDAYGYYAFDNTDTDYPGAVPTFDWIECSTLYQGQGTKLPLGDNQIEVVNLPFPFTYYGQTYDRLAVCDNGWIAFDTSTYYDFYNWHMPNVYGSGAQIAPFWDNLDGTKRIYADPQHQIEGILIADGVYTWYDAANHRYVVEWSRMPNYNPLLNELHTFEIVLYDPDYVATESGNGVFMFQYKQIANNDPDRMFATTGIESEQEDAGLEYSYANLYPAAAAPLGSGLAIRFTTDAPRFEPPKLRSFEAHPSGSGVIVSWEPADTRPRSGFRIYRGQLGGDYAPVGGALLDPATRTFLDATADPDSSYAYEVGSLDPFGRETLLGPFVYAGRGAAAMELALEARTPNPFRGVVSLTYSLPRACTVELRVHDLSGRLVRTLLSGSAQAGLRTATWDGKDESGRDLPSGIYLCRLSAGKQNRNLKLTLLR